MKKFITKNTNETKKLGAKLAAALKGKEILALYGDLGAGKTTFVQGLAKGLGVKEPVQSPTFVLLNIYKTPHPALSLKRRGKIKYFVHVDAYRLKNPEEALNIGLTDYLGRPDTVVVIEWAEKLEEILKNYRLKKISLKLQSPTKHEVIIH